MSPNSFLSHTAAGRRMLWQRSLMGLILLMSLLPAFAQTRPDTGRPNGTTYALNRERSKILFSISHFVVSSTQGEFANFDGKLILPLQAPERGSVTVHVSPGSISTGIAARDEHLRTADFFDAAAFPVATFQSTSATQTTKTTGKLSGMLTLHGITKPVTLNVMLQTLDLNGDKLSFSASGTLRRSDFDMNNYAGVIGDEVSLNIEAEFDRER